MNSQMYIKALEEGASFLKCAKGLEHHADVLMYLRDSFVSKTDEKEINGKFLALARKIRDEIFYCYGFGGAITVSLPTDGDWVNWIADEFYKLEKNYADRLSEFVGVNSVLISLLNDCAEVLRTIDPDDSDEADRLNNLPEVISLNKTYNPSIKG